MYNPNNINYVKLTKNVHRIINNEPFHRGEGFTFTALMMINGFLLQGKKVCYLAPGSVLVEDFKRDLAKIMQLQFGEPVIHRSRNYANIPPTDGSIVFGNLSGSHWSNNLRGLNPFDYIFIDMDPWASAYWSHAMIHDLEYTIASFRYFNKNLIVYKP